MRVVRSPNPVIGRRRGFTLIETSVAVAVLGTAVAAMCQLLTTGTAVNVEANELTTAVNLAGSIHELAAGLPYRDRPGAAVGDGPFHNVWDLDGATFSPAVDAARVPISSDGQWSQQVSVRSVDNESIDKPVESDRTGSTAQLVVTVCHHGRSVYTGRWLIVNASP